MKFFPYYLAILDGHEGAYGVTFPDFGGCCAMGYTQEEARQNAIDVLEEWLGDAVKDGFMPNYIRTVDELMEDEDVRELISIGGKIIAIPAPQSTLSNDIPKIEHAFMYQALRHELARKAA